VAVEPFVSAAPARAALSPAGGSLAGRRALVTGASRGIGRAIALALAEAGADVALTYCRRATDAEAVRRAVEGRGRRAAAVALDAGSPASIESALAAVRAELGRVDILVNNGAIAQEVPFECVGVDDWDRMLAVNLRGPFLCCQRLLPDMRAAGWGRIVNLVSVGGQWGGVRQVHYAAAKAGLVNLTRSLARIAGDSGVTANAVSPGLVRTEMTEAELASPDGRRKLEGMPARRVGTPEEVAAAVVFLASDAAAYITGQTLNVNGGLYFG
jgi:acetoacetyl-CoA reductase/3-oxoacyl-[acyl-carrier protein] reductase